MLTNNMALCFLDAFILFLQSNRNDISVSKKQEKKRERGRE